LLVRAWLGSEERFLSVFGISSDGCDRRNYFRGYIFAE
jgi:hypothetical protein